MSTFKMGILTFIICLGGAGYIWCSWPENRCLNDVKDDLPSGYVKINPDEWEACGYCGCLYLRGGSCYNGCSRR